MSSESSDRSEARKSIRWLFEGPRARIGWIAAIGFACIALGVSSNGVIYSIFRVVGITILSGGVFSAVTHAIIYGGTFRKIVLDAVSSAECGNRVRHVLAQTAGVDEDSVNRRLRELLSNEQTILAERSFERAAQRLLKEDLNTAWIFAHTSTKYCSVLRNGKRRVRNVRLLVSSPSTVQHASTHSQKPTIAKELDLTLDSWREAQDDGLFETVSIRYHDFAPNFHFMIVNDCAAQFGLLRPRGDGAGVTSMHCFAVRNTTNVGQQMVADLSQFFESAWEDADRNKAAVGDEVT